MKHDRMRKNLFQTIRRSLGRFLAITAIIALGCALFVGLRVTRTDMLATGQRYADSQNMFDLRLLNTYGWSLRDVDRVRMMEGVAQAEGSFTLDVFANSGGEDQVYRLHAIPKDINKVYLLGGRMPQSADECLVDGAHADESVLGKKIYISDANDGDTLNSLRCRSYTVVGYVSTPLYMDLSRGSTTLGSGSLSGYIYIPGSAFDMDYYTEIYVTIPGAWTVYSQAHTDAMDAAAEKLEHAMKPLADERLAYLRSQAEKSYADGLAEYERGLAEYETAKNEALGELEDALKALQDGQKELDENRKTLEDGEKQLSDAQSLLDGKKNELQQGRVELENKRGETFAQLAESNALLMENYKTVTAGLRELEAGMAQLQDGLAQLDSGLSQIDDGIAQIEEGLPQLELLLSLSDAGVRLTQAALDQARQDPLVPPEQLARLEESLAEQIRRNEELAAQKTEAETQLPLLRQKREELTAQRAGLLEQQKELNGTKAELDLALRQINDGFMELENGKFQAENQFAAAEAQLNAGALELENGQKQLDEKKAELDAGRAELEAGQTELDAGWEEYNAGKAQADRELAEGAAELADAKEQLADARAAIDAMDDPAVYALTRNSNAGYMALDNNSQIVSGVATVLPAFFLLIAALVCITTMTRMVEEERTQIGTLKALGYSSGAIMGKYLLYSMFAAVLGCGLGVAAGSAFFPWILWNAYGILFNITPGVELIFDWKLSLLITAAYIGVSSLVTWYSCHHTLREVPAELIRPKAPAAGKKIWLEKLPFWNKIGFLNKVMLRNVLRYRQRFLMMIVGIGGCTALLLTGFGLGDTIIDVAKIQFSQVDLYDVQVYFGEGKTPEEQQEFRDALGEKARSVGFAYQSSVELDYGGRSRELYLLMAGPDIREFLDLHRGGEQLSMPGPGEAYLSVGMAELLGVSVGDTVTARNADMERLQLRVTGIYENHVGNYLIVTPETVAAQWGRVPEYQAAFVTVPEGTDVHDASGIISSMEGVMNITVAEDLQNQVSSMMEALEVLVLVVVCCAGLLGAIVLYNLTNININERIREIATIKVLGFNGRETSAYVFKENILLTVLGAGFGLLLGRAFLEFVMSKIRIDMVWFKTRLAVPSYFYAIALTLVCAFGVALVFHRRLQRINMAEALKSVE